MEDSKVSQPTLTEQQGQVLLTLARQTLAQHLRLTSTDDGAGDLKTRLLEKVFQTACGAFVTLKMGEQLRGCIGSLDGREPLAVCVRNNAINAAFHDPRFPPLSEEEFDRINIDVSVLTPSQPLRYRDVEDLLAQLHPDLDGVTIRKHHASATFLPQVWRQLPRKEDFLSQLCLKAGLPADAWRKDHLEVETYRVQYFEERHL